MQFKTGTLVRARGRDWVVGPSGDDELLILTPLGGYEEEACGLFLPLLPEGAVCASSFPAPGSADLGSARAARLLADAGRLSLRSAAGPFRSAARLGFRPRSYQLVPLVMALRQEGPIRLLVADDVGIGKTAEALLIVKELLERREIDRFAVICPPHLCEQWQAELADKFGIAAVIVRSGTQASLDRQVRGDASVFRFFPFQVISIDYIKGDNRYRVFAAEAPDFIIVDEVHSSARPEGTHTGQQLRHRLLDELAKKAERHLVLLTATPHSGKDAEFRSLLGLLDRRFLDEAWEQSDREAYRKELARRFVQRRRADIERWLDETTPFPRRASFEAGYGLAPGYRALYEEVVAFVTSLLAHGPGRTAAQKRFRYWAALALLRGVMSSPAAGALMLENRATRLAEDDGEADEANPVIESLEDAADGLPAGVLERPEWTRQEQATFRSFAARLAGLAGTAEDAKLAACLEALSGWLADGFSPVVFCRYIETARYLASHCAAAFGAEVTVACVTSEDPDEVRRERVAALGQAAEGRRVLIATDCLSEGINLQDQFDAVIHYDLPWNPNRLEQREGRVDRFGQPRGEVRTLLLFGQDNPMDSVVLKVLYRKVKAIRDDLGVSISFPEDSKVLLDTIFHAVLDEAARHRRALSQPELFANETLVRGEGELETVIRERVRREAAVRGIFAQHGLAAADLEEDLAAADAAVGRPETVFRFLTGALSGLFGLEAAVDHAALTLRFPVANAPEFLRPWLPATGQARLACRAPVPQGYRYWGRNHPAVEALCQAVMLDSLSEKRRWPAAARAAVILSGAVTERTVVWLLRARHVIEDRRRGTQLVAEEFLVHGYAGAARTPLPPGAAEALLDDPAPQGDLAPAVQQAQLERELSLLPTLRAGFDALACERAAELIRQHERYYRALGRTTRAGWRMVEPVIPMDTSGVYIFLPGGST